jgi:hypothetical protein
MYLPQSFPGLRHRTPRRISPLFSSLRLLTGCVEFLYADSKFPQIFKNPLNKRLVLQMLEAMDKVSQEWLEDNGFSEEVSRYKKRLAFLSLD